MEYLASIEPLIIRVRHMNQLAAMDFIFAELTVGITRCRIARSRHSFGLSATSIIEQADAALLTATQLMQRFKNVHPHFDQMTALAERLRMELDALQPLRHPPSAVEIRGSAWTAEQPPISNP